MGRIPLETKLFAARTGSAAQWMGGQIQASLMMLERAFGNLNFGLLLVFQSTSGIGLAPHRASESAQPES
jgi:hypothetical protein